MRSKAEKQVEQLSKDNLALVQAINSLNTELAESYTALEAFKADALEIRQEVSELEHEVRVMEFESLPTQRRIVAICAQQLMAAAAKNNIAVCLFIDDEKGCTYHTTASVGRAIDMFSNAAKCGKNLAMTMEMALKVYDNN